MQCQNRRIHSAFLNRCLRGWVQCMYLFLSFFRAIRGMWQKRQNTQQLYKQSFSFFQKKNKRSWPLSPAISTSKNTRGLSAFPGLATGVGFDIFFYLFYREKGLILPGRITERNALVKLGLKHKWACSALYCSGVSCTEALHCCIWNINLL